jgi:Domain of unknown function (DUF3846)
MKGAALIYRPGQAEPEVKLLGAVSDHEMLDLLQGAVGGYIEVVPQFDNVRFGEGIERCRAFCNEHGKLQNLAFNEAATEAWEQALPTGLRNPSGAWLDYLVGTVVVVFGDDEFMDAL